jgi:hypothetical protein
MSAAEAVMRVPTMILVVPLLLTHVGCAPADVGPRAKPAAGCGTVEACTALHDEAAGSGDAVIAERKRVAAEQAKYRDDAKRLGSSCQDITALEAAAAAIRQQEPSDPTLGDRRRADEYVASEYSKLAQERRDDRVRRVTGEIGSWLKAFVSLQDADNPAQAREDIPKTRALLEDLHCYDAAAADKLRADVDAWASAREKAISDEETCRATPACMGARVAVPLCEAIATRRGAMQDIARQRANRAGAVNLALVHDLRQQVQEDDATITELRAKYLATTHKGFDDASCPKPR